MQNEPNPFNDRDAMQWMDAVLQRFRSITLVGLPDLKDRNDIATEALYVPMRLGGEPGVEPERVEDALVRHRRVVALGDPGSGKSTIIAWLCVSISLRLAETARSPVARHLPVPILLRDLRLDPSVNTLDALLERAAGQDWWAAHWKAGLREWLERGQAVLMVDGLDEVPDVETRRAVGAALRDAALQHPRMAVLVTSRVVGYDDAPVDVEPERADQLLPLAKAVYRYFASYSRLYVQPFDDSQIEAFARRWYRVRTGVGGRADEQAARFIRALRDAPGLHGLAANPSLLALMALVHRVYTTLPSGRAILFEKMTEAYLESIDRARSLPGIQEHWRTKQRWLARLATAIQKGRGVRSEEGQLHLTRADALEILTAVIGSGSVAAQFLDEVLRRSGILVPRSDATVAFGHLSFLEYLSAVQLVEELQTGAFDAGVLAEAREKARSWSVSAEGREPLVLAFELLAQGSPAAARGLYSELRKGVERRSLAERGAFAALAVGLEEDIATSVGEMEDARRFKREALIEDLKHHSVPSWCRDLTLLDGDPSVREILIFGAPARFNFAGLEALSGLTRFVTFIGGSAAHLPADAPLVHLTLDTEPGLITRIVRYTSLEYLGLAGAPQDGLAGLAQLPCLRALDLYCGCSADDIAALSLLPLVKVTLMGDCLSAAGCQIPWRKLSSLTLGGSNVWSTQVLAPLRELDSLHLYGTRWIAGPAVLPRLPKLQTLYLDNSGLTDLTSLLRCRSLRSIYVSSNSSEASLVPEELRRRVTVIPF